MRILICCLVFAGCTDASGGFDLVLDGPAVLVSYREGAAAWKVPDARKSGDGSYHYQLDVNEPFEVAVVCIDVFGRYWADELFAMPADGEAVVTYWAGSIDCGAAPAVATETVVGQMAESGFIAMPGTAAGGLTAPWSFQVQVPAGNNDLVAVNANHSAASIRHDQGITDSVSENLIDLSTEGAALRLLPIDLAGVQAGERVSSQLYLATKNGAFVTLVGTNSSITAFPPALLRSDDFQAALVAVTILTGPAQESIRSAFLVTDGAQPLAATLMPRLDGIVLSTTAIAGSWSVVPDEYDVIRVEYGQQGGTQQVSATRTWLDALGATALQFDDTVPDYSATWRVDPATAGKLFSAEIHGTSASFATVETSGSELAAIPPRPTTSPRGVALMAR